MGQVGDGTNTDRASPTAVASNLSFSALPAHGASNPPSSTCAVAWTVDMYCWGLNDFGQVGDGTTTNRNVPSLVGGGLSWKAVTIGYRHVCGLTTSYRAFCWGFNSRGQLGDGTTHPTLARTYPTEVYSGGPWQSIEAGDLHTCGLDMDGGLACWGNNDKGQLGIGTTVDKVVPTSVSSNVRWASISLQQTGRSCGLSVQGVAYCWGQNDAFENGAAPNTYFTTPIAAWTNVTYSSISAGYHVTCGIPGTPVLPSVGPQPPAPPIATIPICWVRVHARVY